MNSCIVLAFAFALASVLDSSFAAVARPDVDQLESLEKSVFAYQASIQKKVKKYRQSNADQPPLFFNQTMEIVLANLRNISAADTAIRATLSAQTQSPCILNFVSFLDDILELSGYSTSNCVLLKSNSTLEQQTYQFPVALDAFEKGVNLLAQMIPNSLVGRNIFTEGETILKLLQDRLVAKTAEYDAIVIQYDKLIKTYTAGYVQDLEYFKSCHDGVFANVQSAIAAVQDQLPTCTQFDGRAPRFAVLDPYDFFPEFRPEEVV